MATYAAFRPTAAPASRGVPVHLERFTSAELPARMLQERVRAGRSRVYYLHQVPPRSLAQWPVAEFPAADATACMAVWLRRRTAPGAQERPDERWTLSPGGAVVRRAWAAGQLLAPEPVVLARGAAPVYVCGACFQRPSAVGSCRCS